MSSDFYKKNAALYEEFQRKELYFLNEEKKLHSYINSECKNSTLQEYMDKIKLREKETEETYKGLMKQMEELDKRTEIMSFNLEKLNILRNTIFDSRPPSWKGFQDRFNEPVSFGAVLSSRVSSSVIPDYNYQIEHIIKHDAYTQTENVVCDKCQHILCQKTTYAFIKNSLSTLEKTEAFESSIDEHSFPKTSTPFDLKTLDINDSLKPMFESSIQENILHFSSHQDESMLRKKSLDDHVTASNLDSAFDLNNEVMNLNNKNVLSKDSSDALNVEKVSIPEKPQEVDNLTTLKKVLPHEPNVAKSDNESMNNEFDFLESEKSDDFKSEKVDLSAINSSKKVLESNSSNPSISNYISEVDDEKPNKNFPSPHKNNNLINKNEIDVKKNYLEVKTDDLSESSMSAMGAQSPLHSDPVSAESDLDSFFDKETPLTDTAAYQALLGNISFTDKKKAKQVSTDSDSEDSVEKALSKVVRKPSSSISTEQLQPQKDALKVETSQPMKEKSRNSKTINQNKLQFDVLKNRQKVLCFDSSGSEIEAEIKPAVKAVASDDDEFDF